MDREHIIQMALEAGLTEPDFGDWMIDYGYAEDQITKFAELVRAATKEEDAKICDDLWQDDCTAMDCRDQIRVSK